ncbi:RHS repeat domain-containing protein [Burkholderia ubonensis]|uniref:RHS repeat domain-containing protein n=1 Tax=Burkholderia ubonensis TaxID=101571 RepID=UPI000A70C307|nr:RHS repeat-associated core domain-containing protein [Burkholderia ubonensis]
MEPTSQHPETTSETDGLQAVNTEGTREAVPGLYSHATNFLSFVQSSVDARTGLFTCTAQLPEVLANDLMGPSVALGLSYSPLGDADVGYGRGWSLSLSRYDKLARVLYLSTGEQFRVDVPNPAGYTFKDRKLPTFRMWHFRAPDGHTYYRLDHKSGMVELLSDERGQYNVALPAELHSPTGRRVYFFYVGFNGHRRLARVQDEAARELLRVTREPGALDLSVRPGTHDEARYTLRLSNDRVTRLVLPTVENAGWQLDYDTAGRLVRVISPLGGEQRVNYSSGNVGHRLPDGAPTSRLSYVISHTSEPGQDQPPTVTTYRYTEYNFLGYGAPNLSWRSGEDNLYRVVMPAEQPYLYGSSATVRLANGRTREVTRRYNRFHLQTLERTECGDTVLQVDTDYYDQPDLSFEQQPAYCQLPRSVTTTWLDTSVTPARRREQRTQTTYDDAGNVVREQDETGLIVKHSYYPAGGEAGLCPPDPLGLVRSVKEVRTTPASGPELESGAGVTIKRYRYALMENLVATEPDMLVPLEESLLALDAQGGEQQLWSVQRLHVEDRGPHHGRLREEVRTADGLATTTHYSYALVDGTLETVRTEHGFDGVQHSHTRRESITTGLTLEDEGADGVQVRRAYDLLGRAVSVTLAPGTAFEATHRYAYQLAVGTQAAWQEETNPNGVRQRRYLDGDGRLIRVALEDVDHAPGTYRVVQRVTHDNSGNVVEVQHTDWAQGQAQPVRTTHHAYDAWGNVISTTGPDGVRQCQSSDPIDNVERSWLETAQGVRGAMTVIHHNVFGQPTLVHRYDARGERLGTARSTYDGLGRLVQTEDALGQRTRYAYDALDRRSAVTLPDGAVVQTEYAAHLEAAQPSCLRLVHDSVGGELTLGQRVFDGLGRLSAETVANRRRQLHYVPSQWRPARQTTPTDHTLRYTYEKQLGEQLVRLEAEEAATYTYHGRSGQLQQAERAGQHKQYEYAPSGLLKLERWVQGDGASVTAYHRQTLQGAPLSYVDVFGAEHVRTYDDVGRPEHLRYGDLETTLDYDGFGRLASLVCREGARTVRSDITYDDFGREVRRVWQVTGAGPALTQTLEQHYDVLDRLVERVLMTGSTLQRRECFTYDAAGRLSEYVCEGPARPLDPWGKAIDAQVFTYDALDRLQQLETRFEAGSDSGVDVARWHYTGEDPTQPTRITHSHPDYPQSTELRWDAGGRLVREEHDGRGRTLTWNAQNQLVAVQDDGREPLTYGYDAQGLLTQPPQGTRYYRGTEPVCEQRGATKLTWLSETGQPLAQAQSAPTARLTLLIAAMSGSVCLEVDSAPRPIAYAPHGHRAEGQVALAFNGEPLEAEAGLYLLGAGHHRPYSPTLMCFLAPDSASPFGAGGLNPYAYCAGDPINRTDPSGHFWKWIVAGVGLLLGAVATVLTAGAAAGAVGAVLAGGIGALTASGAAAITGTTLGVVSLATGAGSLVADATGNAQASDILGWVSLGTGIASAVAAAAPAAVKAATRAHAALSRFTQRIQTIKTTGLSGRGGPAAGRQMASGSSLTELMDASEPVRRRILGNLSFRDQGRLSQVSRGMRDNVYAHQATARGIPPARLPGPVPRGGPVGTGYTNPDYAAVAQQAWRGQHPAITPDQLRRLGHDPRDAFYFGRNFAEAGEARASTMRWGNVLTEDLPIGPEGRLVMRFVTGAMEDISFSQWGTRTQWGTIPDPGWAPRH